MLILSDENGVPLATAEQLRPSIELADAVLREQANIRLRHIATHVVAEPAPTEALIHGRTSCCCWTRRSAGPTSTTASCASTRTPAPSPTWSAGR